MPCAYLVSLFFSCCLLLCFIDFFVMACFDSFLIFFCSSSIGISLWLPLGLLKYLITTYFKLITSTTNKNTTLLLYPPPFVTDVTNYIFLHFIASNKILYFYVFTFKFYTWIESDLHTPLQYYMILYLSIYLTLSESFISS